jgi:hypothetical protein
MQIAILLYMEFISDQARRGAAIADGRAMRELSQRIGAAARFRDLYLPPDRGGR